MNEVERKAGTIKVENRMDGAHISWYYHEHTRFGITGVQRHEIILKSLDQKGLISSADVQRVQAFAATITECDGKKPKLDQKHWEKWLKEGKLPQHKDHAAICEKVIKQIKATADKQLSDEVRYSRDGLSAAVKRALKHFTPEECKQIYEEAVVEEVMKT